ncbi:electron transfer flavoprotein subunit beta/FixA family protein [bacterium]|nr:electron transfer flavoprotein subunit beta/FixA family protein [bacterium]
MRIVVIVKEVADTEAVISLKDGLPDLSATAMVNNPYDEYAVEEALQQADKLGDCTVTAVMVGREKSKENLRKILAMGVGEAVLIDDEALAGADPLQIAQVLKAAIEPLEPAFVLAGRQGVDYDWGLAPLALAELLGWGHVGLIAKLEITGSAFKAETEGDDGLLTFEGSLPAVFTADKSLNEPRYPSLKGIMQAKKKPLETKTLADLGLDAAAVGGAAAGLKLINCNYPPRKEAGRVIAGETAAEKAAALVKALREEAKVI